jgi:hypothetical protein
VLKNCAQGRDPALCGFLPLVHQFKIYNKRPADEAVAGVFANSLIVSGKICRTPARRA